MRAVTVKIMCQRGAKFVAEWGLRTQIAGMQARWITHSATTYTSWIKYQIRKELHDIYFNFLKEKHFLLLSFVSIIESFSDFISKKTIETKIEFSYNLNKILFYPELSTSGMI